MWSFFRSFRIDIWSQSIYQWVYKDWTSIFDEKHCPPSYLSTEVFHIYCALVSEACWMYGCCFGIVNGRTIAAFGDTKLVDREFGLSSKLLIQFWRFCTRIYCQCVWEVLDRLALKLLSVHAFHVRNHTSIPLGRICSSITLLAILWSNCWGNWMSLRMYGVVRFVSWHFSCCVWISCSLIPLRSSGNLLLSTASGMTCSQ